jgi:hypothetical protein
LRGLVSQEQGDQPEGADHGADEHVPYAVDDLVVGAVGLPDVGARKHQQAAQCQGSSEQGDDQDGEHPGGPLGVPQQERETTQGEDEEQQLP